MNTLTTRRAYRSARRRRSVLKALLSGVVATAIAVTLAVAGSGATLAILSSNTVAMPSTSIIAGTAVIDVSKPSAFTLLAPGIAQGRSITVTNTGNAALGLTVESATFAGTLASQGVPTTRIRDYLGHSSVAVTETYYVGRCREAVAEDGSPALKAAWTKLISEVENAS